MSDIEQGPGWWQGVDGKWYPPMAPAPSAAPPQGSPEINLPPPIPTSAATTPTPPQGSSGPERATHEPPAPKAPRSAVAGAAIAAVLVLVGAALVFILRDGGPSTETPNVDIAGMSSDSQGTTGTIPATTAATTTTSVVATTTTLPATTVPQPPEEVARALFRYVTPDTTKMRAATGQLSAALLSSDPTLIAVPGQLLLDLYNDSLTRWNEVNLDKLDEPYRGVFEQLRQGAVLDVASAEAMVACKNGCDPIDIVNSMAEASQVGTEALIQLGALIPITG